MWIKYEKVKKSAELNVCTLFVICIENWNYCNNLQFVGEIIFQYKIFLTAMTELSQGLHLYLLTLHFKPHVK